MTTLHDPVRGKDENRAQYRERQAKSKASLLRATRPPMQRPAVSRLDYSRFWLGLHTNPDRNRQRKITAALGGVRQVKRRRQAVRAAQAAA